MIAAYFHQFIEVFGQSWNRFWYTPSNPLPLGVIRVLAGLIAIASLVTFTPDVDRLLSKSGMMPVEVVVGLQTPVTEDGKEVRPWRWSYLDYLSSRDLHVAHWCGLAVLVAYTLGIYTRATSILALIVVLSYLHRLPMVAMYHERILAFVMFFVALGPAGARLSLDRWLANRKGLPALGNTWTATVSLRMMQIQFAVMCFMMALAKLSTGGDMWWPGLAVWWLAQAPGASLIDLKWLGRNHQFLINFWSHAIVFFELAFPFLIWRPILQPLLITIGVAIWLSVMVLTGQVLFILSLLTALLCFVTGEQMMALAQCCGCCRQTAKA
jgi:hypothetical protein